MLKSSYHFAGRLPVEQVYRALKGEPFVAPQYIALWLTFPLDNILIDALIHANFFSQVEILTPNPKLNQEQNKRIIRACPRLRELHIQSPHDIDLLEEPSSWPHDRPFHLYLCHYPIDLRKTLSTGILNRPLSLTISGEAQHWHLDTLSPYLSNLLALHLAPSPLTKQNIPALQKVASHITSLFLEDEHALWKLLQELDFPRLKSFRLRSEDNMRMQVTLHSDNLPSLEELHLTGLNKIKVEGLPDRLQQLKIIAPEPQKSILSFVHLVAPQLEVLEVGYHLKPMLEPEILMKAVSLTHLHAPYTHWDEPMLMALQNCTKLQALTTRHSKFKEGQLFKILASLPHLKHLDIGYSQMERSGLSSTPLSLKSLDIGVVKASGKWLPDTLLDRIDNTLETLTLNFLDLNGILNLTDMFPHLQDLEARSVIVDNAAIFHGLEKSLRYLTISPSKLISRESFAHTVRTWIDTTSLWPHLEALDMHRLNIFQALLSLLQKHQCPMLTSLSCGIQDKQDLDDYLSNPNVHNLSYVRLSGGGSVKTRIDVQPHLQVTRYVE